MNSVKPILSCRDISKSYHQGSEELKVLTGLNLEVNVGENVAIIGVSGSGKSTLLHILGGLDRPDNGEIIISGQSLWQQNSRQRELLRNQKLGFIYQFHHLLPEFTALENVAMPLLIRGWQTPAAATAATELLQRVGLEQRLGHKPAELSGGERQRAAVARALVGKPEVVLGDEPTGNLDEVNAKQIWDLMLELNQEMQTSLVLVTHDAKLAQRMDRQFILSQGQLQERTS